MLYIFLVDTGTMVTFEMNLALERVTKLREVIAQILKIPKSAQVLLVSGGETLISESLVGSYSGGTDTNPIFLYSKARLNSNLAPTYHLEYSELNHELNQQAEECLNMDANLITVQKRTQIAKEICEISRGHSSSCEQLVLDQHLQQQGWAAVVANLEDITVAFSKRAAAVEENFHSYLKTRDGYIKLLEGFKKEVIGILSEIKVIPALLESSSVNDKNNTSLFEWVSSSVETNHLVQITEECSNTLEQINQNLCDSFKREVQTALLAASQNEMKEIKGLGERLCGLEDLRIKSQKIVQEQVELAQSFLNNHSRASNLGDTSIFPDLCASHKRQLQVMLKNDVALRDFKFRIANAKKEFCENLYQRLRWVMYVQNNFLELEDKFLLYNENVKRLKKHLQIIEQLYMAPSLYANACSEVVRRRAFSKTFLCWANQLASEMLAIHNEEVSQRAKFQAEFDGHLLHFLFPGLEDKPSAYATQPPPDFDTFLPNIKLIDLENLKSSNLMNIEIPDLSHIISFFVKYKNSKYIDKNFATQMNDALSSVGLEKYKLNISKDPEIVEKPIEEKQRNASIEKSETPPLSEIFPITTESNIPPTTTSSISTIPTTTTLTTSIINTTIPGTEDGTRHDRGFDSETDTEDFEKVAADAQLTTIEVRSPDLTAEFALQDIYLDESLPSSLTDPPPPQRQLTDAKALLRLLQENLGNTRAEVERLRMLSSRYGASSLAMLSGLRGELASARKTFENQSSILRAETLQILESVQKTSEDLEERLKKYKDQLQLSNQEISYKNEQLTSLENQLSEEVRHRLDISQALEKAQSFNTILEEKISSYEINQKKALKDLEEKLQNEHQQELKLLKKRYKMLKERIPSESSVEQSELFEKSGPLISTSVSLPIQQSESSIYGGDDKNAEAQLRRARTRDAAEKQIWFNESVRHVVEEKDKQINDLRVKESILLTEITNKDKTISDLIETSSEHNDSILSLQERIKVLELDKTKLISQLEGALLSSVTLYCEPSTSAVSTSILTSRDAATSPEPSIFEEDPLLRDKLTRSTRTLLQQGKIKTSSCRKGDIVLVIWDDEHHNYIIYQRSSHSPMLYFVQNYSLDSLGLQVQPGERPTKLSIAAEVYDKECCIAKKSENRYRVPEGTKFYRVAVRPFRN